MMSLLGARHVFASALVWVKGSDVSILLIMESGRSQAAVRLLNKDLLQNLRPSDAKESLPEKIETIWISDHQRVAGEPLWRVTDRLSVSVAPNSPSAKVDTSLAQFKFECLKYIGKPCSACEMAPNACSELLRGGRYMYEVTPAGQKCLVDQIARMPKTRSVERAADDIRTTIHECGIGSLIADLPTKASDHHRITETYYLTKWRIDRVSPMHPDKCIQVVYQDGRLSEFRERLGNCETP